MKNKLCALLLIVAGGILTAAESKTVPDIQSLAPSTLVGKVIALDKAIRALTVEINGKPLQVNVTQTLKITRSGKLTSFEDLVIGQKVALTFVEIQGRLEVVLVNIEGNPSPTEAAGKGGTGAKPTVHPGSMPSPFPGNANPANNNGFTRSKNK